MIISPQLFLFFNSISQPTQTLRLGKYRFDPSSQLNKSTKSNILLGKLLKHQIKKIIKLDSY